MTTPATSLASALDLLGRLRLQGGQSLPTSLFGGPAGVSLGIGFKRRLVVLGNVPSDEAWEAVNAFFEQAEGHVVGYIGFEMAWPDEFRRLSPEPMAELWEPETTIDYRSSAGVAVSGTSSARISEMIQDQPPAFMPDSQPLPRFLSGAVEAKASYEAAVQEVLTWIATADGERLTVARRVELPDWVRPLDAVAPAVTPYCRSVYLHSEHVELGGCSPELLLCGRGRAYTCFKLSGTAQRSSDASGDLFADPKLCDEHAKSIRSTAEALRGLGSIHIGERAIIERTAVSHGMTPIGIDLSPDVAFGRLLRASMPAGATPRHDGLRVLRSIEQMPRGAYYGLLVHRDGEGYVNVSQALRCVYRAMARSWTWVGAAVTNQSSPDGEWNETCAKLQDVLIWAPHSAGQG